MPTYEEYEEKYGVGEYIQRRLFYPGFRDQARLLDITILRDKNLSKLSVFIEGELALEITADSTGHAQIEFNDGEGWTLCGLTG